MPLIDYDANVYRPRFIDVPTADLVTGLTGASARAWAHAATARTSAAGAARPGAKPRAAGPIRLPVPPAHVIFPPALRALGAAQLKAQRASGRAASSAAST
jgi:hypothetical protein